MAGGELRELRLLRVPGLPGAERLGTPFPFGLTNVVIDRVETGTGGNVYQGVDFSVFSESVTEHMVLEEALAVLASRVKEHIDMNLVA